MKWNLNGSGVHQHTLSAPYGLSLSALVLLFVALLGNSTVFARYEQRPTYQESPLSPLATPVTSTLTITLPLPVTNPTPVVASVAPTVTLQSPLTVTQRATVTQSATVTNPAAASVLVNRGQTSLLLVGTVFIGILLVTALVIGRQR